MAPPSSSCRDGRRRRACASWRASPRWARWPPAAAPRPAVYSCGAPAELLAAERLVSRRGSAAVHHRVSVYAEAAVGGEQLTGDELGLVGGEEAGRVGDVHGVAQAGEPASRALADAHPGVAPAAHDPAHDDAVAPDAVWGALDGQDAGEAVHAPLGRGVGAEAGEAGHGLPG